MAFFVFRSLPSDGGRLDHFSIDTTLQAHIDTLKKKAFQNKAKIYPFNPNYITDFKGYSLGMSVSEIDRLHHFRKQNKFANSPKEFQRVTQISDSLLEAISPYFKFPEWTRNSKQLKVGSNRYKDEQNNHLAEEGLGKNFSERDQIKDLNAATIEDLRAINGIGEVLSTRIIKFR